MKKPVFYTFPTSEGRVAVNADDLHGIQVMPKIGDSQKLVIITSAAEHSVEIKDRAMVQDLLKKLKKHYAYLELSHFNGSYVVSNRSKDDVIKLLILTDEANMIMVLWPRGIQGITLTDHAVEIQTTGEHEVVLSSAAAFDLGLVESAISEMGICSVAVK